MVDFKYKAFISYSHEDEKWGRWLHKRLETYPIPAHLIGKKTKTGIVPKHLRPIFRDHDELAAADNLGENIEQALAQSENLIIICSPHAAHSHWVNQEVLFFKRHNRNAKIFCVIVDGTPLATNNPGHETSECFPPALRFQLDDKGELSNKPAEPLAADICPHADGKRLGTLKLVSGMIGVGLDEIVQRDMQRGKKRVMAITASSLAAVIAMGALTGFALAARKEADLRRADAEENIEFMITDLKKELEPVGRLSALKVVGERAENYYDKYPISKHNDEALGRRARVFHYLGEIQDKLGDLKEAERYFQRAYNSTKVLLVRNPNNPDRIFEHAQSAYWAGYVPYWNAAFDNAEIYFQEYADLATALRIVESDSLRSQQEITYAYTNLGILFFKQGANNKAYQIYQSALPAYLKIVTRFPDNTQYQLDLADAYGWLADAGLKMERAEEAFSYRTQQRKIYRVILNNDPKNYAIQFRDISSATGQVRISIVAGRYEEAEKLIDEAMPIASTLVKTDTANIDWMKAFEFLKLLKIETRLALVEPSASAVLLEDFTALKNQLRSYTAENKQEMIAMQNKRLLLEEKTNKLINTD